MIGNKYLLDTNIISAWLKGEELIADNIDRADGVYLPIIVVGELYYGASFSTHVKKNTDNIKKVISRYTVLTLDEKTTTVYGNIKSSLRRKGRPIPENDIWIAAIAMQHEFTLITRDKHFKEIEGLVLRAW